MFKIGDFSKLSKISIRMLRHYDEIGLLTPSHTNNSNGYRYYSVDQLSTTNRIHALKDMGFSLYSIKEILTEYNDKESLIKYLNIHHSQVKEQLEDIQRKILKIENTIKRIGGNDNMDNYDVTIKNFSQKYMMTLRKVISTYKDEGLLWHQSFLETKEQNIQLEYPNHSKAVFYDTGYQEDYVDVEVQVAVSGKYKDTEHVRFKTVPSVTAATAIVKGNFNQLTDTCEAIGNWISDNNYEMDGPMFNIYHIGPDKDNNPDNWVTEVCFPVKKI
ncbi:HTH-type transcriptional regulator HmrR [Clostridioides difficile]|nr:HTH-type transcriptional regulator HmrR [Clostridioides difficile]CZS06827.1 HTH-type transcriptional regulator HmrR [Clostridioides difficile]